MQSAQLAASVCPGCHSLFSQAGVGRPRQFCLACRPPAGRALVVQVAKDFPPRQCIHCNAEFLPAHSAHNRCAECKRRGINAQAARCVVCGDLRPRGAGSREDVTCHPCRRLGLAPSVLRCAPRPCPVCGEVYQPRRTRAGGLFTRTCSKSCAVRGRDRTSAKPRDYNPKRAEWDNRRRRYERELAAPGLSIAQRDGLRWEWQRLRRLCSYCHERAADTIDHVVPLIRGGTNFEGNLVPACRSCNASKGSLLLVEWRRTSATKLRLLRCSLRRAAA